MIQVSLFPHPARVRADFMCVFNPSCESKHYARVVRTVQSERSTETYVQCEKCGHGGHISTRRDLEASA